MSESRVFTIALLLTACGASAAPTQTAERVTADLHDQCPDQEEDLDGFEDGDGCPDLDNDQDGVLDVDDRCPCHAEDMDGWQDEDGCPDPDNDQDHVADACDSCPNDAETYNGYEDEDGCPDQAPVRINGGRIQIIDRVYFRRNRATIPRRSFPLLDALAETMNANPQLKLVEIEGHANDGERRAQRLGERRAQAVVDALVERGVDPVRLRARSYGSTRPIDPSRPEVNRRAEPMIIEAEEPEPREPVTPRTFPPCEAEPVPSICDAASAVPEM